MDTLSHLQNQGIQTYVTSFENSIINITADKLIVKDGKVYDWAYENDANGLSFSTTTGIINADVEIANIISYHNGNSNADTEGLEGRNYSNIEINGNVNIVDVSSYTTAIGVSIDNNSSININGNLDINHIVGGIQKEFSSSNAINLLFGVLGCSFASIRIFRIRFFSVL